MKITGKRKRIDSDFKYKIGDYIYHNGNRCCIIGYHTESGYGLYYYIQIPDREHNGEGSIDEYGDPIDLSKLNCWFVSAEYYRQ